MAEQEGCLNDAAYDENLLFAACVMHDLGLGTLAAGQARFEVDGADLAASVLTEHGIAAADVDRVWEAIALYSSLGIADRRGLLTYLTHKGVFTDAGRFTDLAARCVRRPPPGPIRSPSACAKSRRMSGSGSSSNRKTHPRPSSPVKRTTGAPRSAGNSTAGGGS